MTDISDSRRLLAAAGIGYLGWRALRWARRRNRQMELAGRVVLITGGSRGLGLVMAREFARQGARVSICARDERELERARRDLEDRGARVLATHCDVADREQVEEWVRRTHEQLGGVAVLVNNASIIQVGPLEAMTVDDFHRAMDVNFFGTVNATFAALPYMRAQRHGRIVNITSIGGKVAVPHLLPYDAAKFAAVGFSEGIRAELARHGIMVTTIVPGLMRTGSPPNAFFKGQRSAEYTWFSLGDATPLTATSAERAARRIVLAARRGETEVTLTWQARLLRLTHGLAPGLVTDALGLVNRVLPGPAPQAGPEGGTDDGQEVRGMRLATRASPSVATILMNRAARRNNQYGGEPLPSAAHAEQVGLEER